MSIATKQFETVKYEVQNNIAIITLDRSTSLNAINDQLTVDIYEALDLAEKDKRIRAVIVTGTGGNFSSGVDLKEVFDRPSPIGEEPSETWREHLNSLLRVSMKMWNHRVPIIAAVEGYALGGAADWVMAADLAIASDNAKFGEPEIQFGAAPPTLMMPWVVGMKKARELLYTGDIIDADEAHRIGIFNKVVPQDELLASALELANKISNIPPSALKITKVTINKVFELMNFKESLDYNLEAGISMFFLNSEKDVQNVGKIIKNEGLKSFLNQ